MKKTTEVIYRKLEKILEDGPHEYKGMTIFFKVDGLELKSRVLDQVHTLNPCGEIPLNIVVWCSQCSGGCYHAMGSIRVVDNVVELEMKTRHGIMRRETDNIRSRIYLSHPNATSIIVEEVLKRALIVEIACRDEHNEAWEKWQAQRRGSNKRNAQRSNL